MAAHLRALVSKKKKRFNEGGFDLDLTYVTDRIIAMGFPSTGVEAVYRNPMPEVQRFFTTYHDNHFKIYNLCSERQYDLNEYFPLVERFPFDDHNPCPLDLLGLFCASVDEYLNEHPDNVVAVHCKAGKGRTGLMIATYLLHSGVCGSADEALTKFGQERTHNAKGVTIPSQMRYVHYYEQILRRREVVVHTYQITHVRFITVPNFDPAITGGGCDPYFLAKINTQCGENRWKETKIYDYMDRVKKVKKFRPHERFVDLDCSSHNLKVQGDVKLIFYDHDQYSADDKMCHVWFSTAFIESNYLCFEKSVIDKACKDKHHRTFDANFKIEIFLHRVDDDEFEITELAGDDDNDTDSDEEKDD